MAHLKQKDNSAAMNAKMRRMTAHYGDADPAMKKLAPTNKFKQEGPEDAVGYGADSDAVSPRSDRPARKSVPANPVATYARGGSVLARAMGGMTKKPGGKKHNKAGTHVNIVVAPHPGGGAMPPPVVGPTGAPPPAMPPMAGPPPAPPGGMPGASPMGGPPRPMMAGAMPPPGGMPPGLPVRKDGGRIKKVGLTGGAGSGEGRKERNDSFAKKGDKKAVIGVEGD